MKTKTQISLLESEIEALREIVQAAYSESVTISEAEKLAARCLHAQMLIAEDLKSSDLDSRMKKNGVKAVRAKVYMEEVAKHEKKPAEGLLDHVLALNDKCNKEQDAYDSAEVKKSYLETYLGIFKDGHIFFRGIAKGKFE